MLILLHGKDSFRSSQKLKKIISGYKKKNKTGVNITNLPEKPSFSDLKDESRQVGMFEEKRLLVGRNILQDKKTKKEVEDNLDALVSGDNILIFREDEEIKGGLIKKITEKKDEALVQKFDKLKGKKLRSWYKRELLKYNTDWERGVISKLIDYIGDDLWRAHNEIAKLANMRMEEVIKKGDVKDHVRPDFETDIFSAIDSLSRGEKGVALELIQKHISKGDSPFYILSMINYQLRNLLIMAELEDADMSYKESRKKSMMSSFVFKKTKSQIKNFNFTQLKKTHNELFKVDLDSKLGKMNPETGLTLIISRF